MRAFLCPARAVRAFLPDATTTGAPHAAEIRQSSVETFVAKRLTKSQSAVMTWLAQGWKAYTAGATRVEVNGNPVCTTATMDSLEKLGLVQRLGVAAWEATEAGRQWRTPRPAES